MAPARQVDDSGTYLSPARALAAGTGLPEADRALATYRAPAFPAALALAIVAFGERPRVFTLMNVGFLFTAALVIRRSLRPRGRLLADATASAIVLYPPLLTSTALVLQELMVAALVALFFATTAKALARSDDLPSLAAGASLGFAALGKVTVLPVGALMLPLVARGRDRPLGGVAAFVFGAALILAPWAAMTRAVPGRYALAPGNAGHALLGGTVSNRIENWTTFPEYVEARKEWEGGARREEPVLDRYLARVALRRISAHPARWLVLCAERALRFMLPARTWFVQVGLSRMGTFGPLYALATSLNVGLFGLTAWLALHALKQRSWPLFVGPIVVFGHQAVYAMSYTSPRYAVTVGPVLLACAGLAIDEIWSPQRRDAVTVSPAP